MSLTEQIYTQALLLAGALDGRQEALLRLVCTSTQRALERMLRAGITVEDCRSDFIGAASLMALAALAEIDEFGGGISFSIGDFSIRKVDGNSAADCLRRQAILVLAPYLRDGFSFAGV